MNGPTDVTRTSDGHAGGALRRVRRVSVAVLLVAGLGVLTVTWAFSNPPGAAPDEPTNYVKAIGTSLGQWLPKHVKVSPGNSSIPLRRRQLRRVRASHSLCTRSAMGMQRVVSGVRSLPTNAVLAALWSTTDGQLLRGVVSTHCSVYLGFRLLDLAIIPTRLSTWGALPVSSSAYCSWRLLSVL